MKAQILNVAPQDHQVHYANLGTPEYGTAEAVGISTSPADGHSRQTAVAPSAPDENTCAFLKKVWTYLHITDQPSSSARDARVLIGLRSDLIKRMGFQIDLFERVLNTPDKYPGYHHLLNAVFNIDPVAKVIQQEFDASLAALCKDPTVLHRRHNFRDELTQRMLIRIRSGDLSWQFTEHQVWTIDSILDQLTHKSSALVIRARFGLDGGKPKTQPEIAAMPQLCGPRRPVTKSDISAEEKKALELLRTEPILSVLNRINRQRLGCLHDPFQSLEYEDTLTMQRDIACLELTESITARMRMYADCEIVADIYKKNEREWGYVPNFGPLSVVALKKRLRDRNLPPLA